MQFTDDHGARSIQIGHLGTPSIDQPASDGTPMMHSIQRQWAQTLRGKCRPDRRLHTRLVALPSGVDERSRGQSAHARRSFAASSVRPSVSNALATICGAFIAAVSYIFAGLS